ncbi:MAG TPA: tetratricopeptide repeat protein [Steroidobacteraceae bacterium]|jgi:lipopolysaccharide biosynthesis regulator YciM|nr:tetratricopeptide repeat protein [Steroidobacteraceae bacterium]
MNPESIWILLGVLFLGGAIGFYASRKPRPSDVGEERLRGNYLAGVNFLVNEQPDRALEAFLRAAELDDDTIETHFALGSLYRRRGEVDRAIRIHQNIATRESLEPSQREQAGFALAQDYLKAGMLDRAEKILQPLAASGAHRMAAMRKLMRIYEQEQDWKRAIEVFRELDKAGRAPQESAIAHYYCELAEEARERGALDEARDHLREARRQIPRFPRGALVRSDIAIEQGDFALAEKLLGAVLAHDAALAIEVVPRLVRLARASGDQAPLARVVEGRADAVNEVAIAAIMADALDFTPLESRVRACLAGDEAIAGLVTAIGRDPASLDARAVADIAAVLRRLAARTPRYRCANCGFSSIDHFWQCPGCKTWDSQRPLLRFDLVAGLEAGKAR